jgi:hypothetical protein
MSELSEYARDALVDHLLKTAAFTVPTNICVALFNGDPEAAGSELSGNSYARVTHNVWNAAADGVATNDGAITFPTATGAWSEADYVALFDATTVGNRLGSGALDVAKTAGDGDTIAFADTELTVAIDA